MSLGILTCVGMLAGGVIAGGIIILVEWLRGG